MYAKVLIEYNSKSIDKTFTYIIPNNLLNIAKVGMKVIVPFATKKINGFIIEITQTYSDAYELKSIIDIVDKNFVLNSELLELGDYLQKKTLCTKIIAYQTMLPSSLKVKEQKTNYNKYLTYIELALPTNQIIAYINANTRCIKQVEILKTLLEKEKILKNSISNSAVETLLSKKIIKITKEQIYRLNNNKELQASPPLSEDQLKVVNSINLNKQETYLLHGITGSGKTEIYIALIKKIVSLNKKAIMLVPEISLTTQIVERFYSRFGSDVAIFHSGLSEGEKYDEYLKILRDEVHIIIGTRSAIFTPVKNLGIIIIDEEHSETYKQDTMPRYHALDMAEFRSKYNNIPLILGSATPSLESMARAQKGVYHYLALNKRIGTSTLPKISIIDMASELKKRNTIFSEILKTKIKERLNKNEQIILLLNRRGYSTIISCKNCGYTFKCPHCDITLTYHKSAKNLRCHYCGYTIFETNVCPKCHENSLYDYGLGTEKLELELQNIFPEARIIRMDADTTQNKGSHEDIINKFKKHEFDILLGTQMISKGLDFPLVTLVGVINADATLNIPDFRSGERTFALLSQVAGRAGRSTLPGEVIIQTFNPDNYTLKCVAANDYMKFYNYEMHNRHKLDYPPFFYLTMIRITSKDYNLASTEINKAKLYLEKHLNSDTILLGPTPSSILKLKNIYRFQIIIKYKKDDNLSHCLKYLDEIYMLNNKVNFEIDNNPLQL